jgi:hypothetical protein
VRRPSRRASSLRAGSLKTSSAASGQIVYSLGHRSG